MPSEATKLDEEKELTHHQAHLKMVEKFGISPFLNNSGHAKGIFKKGPKSEFKPKQLLRIAERFASHPYLDTETAIADYPIDPSTYRNWLSQKGRFRQLISKAKAVGKLKLVNEARKSARTFEDYRKLLATHFDDWK